MTYVLRTASARLLTIASVVASIAFVLWGCSQDASQSRTTDQELTAQQAQLRQGQELFSKRCVSCHGSRGNGLGSRNGPSLQRSAFTYGDSRQDILTTLRHGRPGGMPAYETLLSEQQLKALADYVLYLKK